MERDGKKIETKMDALMNTYGGYVFFSLVINGSFVMGNIYEIKGNDVLLFLGARVGALFRCLIGEMTLLYGRVENGINCGVRIWLQ